jgi:hypothetical protein
MKMMIYKIYLSRCLCLCPNGYREEDKGHLGLFLKAKPCEETSHEVKYVFEVGSARSRPVHRNINNLSTGHGFPTFISHAALFDPKNQHLRDGTILIRCEVIFGRKFDHHK